MTEPPPVRYIIGFKAIPPTDRKPDRAYRRSTFPWPAQPNGERVDVEREIGEEGAPGPDSDRGLRFSGDGNVMGALRIDLGTVREGVNRFSFRFGPEEIGLEEEDAVYREAIEADLELIRTGSTLTVRGPIRTRVERVCSRCLAPTDENVEARLDEIARIEGDRIRLIDDPFDRGYEYLESRNGAFSLDPLVREAILVCSPIKPLCRPDCRGLCPRCGADLNRGDCECPSEEPHPAWEALRKLNEQREKRD